MKKLLIPVVLLGLLMALTYHIRHSKEKETAGGPGPAAAGKRSGQLYVEISALGNLDYFYDHKLGMKLAGRYLGVETEYVGPPDYDMEAMVNAFEQTLAKSKLKGVVVVGFEEVLIPIINKAVERGVPVVTVDADLPDSKRLAFVGTGNYKAGLKGGEKLASLLKGEGEVALLTKPGQSNLEQRISGYKAALSKYKDIEVVQVVDTKSDPNIAAQAAAAVLERHENLAALACVEAAGGLGAATAVRERGLTGEVKIVAMDRGNDILKLIGEGVIQATVVQKTALMPFYAVQLLYNYQNRPVPVTKDNSKADIDAVPQYIDTGVLIVDKENYKYFLRE